MLAVAYALKFTDSGAVRANLTVVGIVDLPLFVIAIVYGLLWKRTTWQGAMAGFFVGGAVGILSYLVIVPKYFDGNLYPFLHAIWPWLASCAAGWHAHLKVYESSMLSIAPFVSSGTAIIVTPIVSLLTRAPKSSDTARIWASFKASTSADDQDDFPLIPRTLAGRIGLVLIAGGFLCFLGGIISAIWGFPSATVMAVSGMIVVFVGGLLRVYTD